MISGFNGAFHVLELSTWLTSTLPAADKRNEIHIAISADQIAANHVGTFTAIPSLEPATIPQTWQENQEGLNEGYYSHCSFRSPTQALPAEVNPRNVFYRLFNKQEQTGGARDLRRTLPVPDQWKLDEYLRTPPEGCGVRKGGRPREQTRRLRFPSHRDPHSGRRQAHRIYAGDV